MATSMIIGLGALWACAGALAYGLTLGFFQRKWPQFAWEFRLQHLGLAGMHAMSGPIGLMSALLGARGIHYGLMFRLLSYEEACAAHRAAYPSLPLPPR